MTEYIGSIWVNTTGSGTYKNIYYGFIDVGSYHAHVVVSGGAVPYWRDVSGLNPLVKGCGSVYFDYN
ncbi:MAG: hypothetical protein AABW89_05105 [Nanoarchaeota archaeon]